MKVHIVYGNYFNGCDNFYHVDSVHETMESAEIQQLLLEESPDKEKEMDYGIDTYEVQTIKL
jgi:hypothetical protein